MLVKKCEKCGWFMDYIPRSYREYINEILGNKNKRGYWECPNCGSIKKIKLKREE